MELENDGRSWQYNGLWKAKRRIRYVYMRHRQVGLQNRPVSTREMNVRRTALVNMVYLKFFLTSTRAHSFYITLLTAIGGNSVDGECMTWYPEIITDCTIYKTFNCLWRTGTAVPLTKQPNSTTFPTFIFRVGIFPMNLEPLLKTLNNKFIFTWNDKKVSKLTKAVHTNVKNDLVRQYIIFHGQLDHVVQNLEPSVRENCTQVVSVSVYSKCYALFWGKTKQQLQNISGRRFNNRNDLTWRLSVLFNRGMHLILHLPMVRQLYLPVQQGLHSPTHFAHYCYISKRKCNKTVASDWKPGSNKRKEKPRMNTPCDIHYCRTIHVDWASKTDTSSAKNWYSNHRVH